MFVTQSLQQFGKSIVVRSSSALAAVVTTNPPSPMVTASSPMLSASHKHIEFNFHSNQIKLKIFPSSSCDLSSSSSYVSKSLPYIWLRANCTCPSCYNRAAQECEIDLSQTDLMSTQPVEIVEVNNNNNNKSTNLRVVWSDGHKSEFELTELERLILAGSALSSNKKTLWNRDIIESTNHGLVRLPYDAYINDQSVLRQALFNVYKYGAVIINNVPANEEEIARICNRIGPIQTSHFGSKQCVVRANLSFADRAYTHLGLRSHTDTAYLKHTAGLEMFHVIKKPKDGGGKSVLVDGFYCADRLRQIDSSAYEFLRRTQVQMISTKQDVCEFRHMAPVIGTDSCTGELEQIRFNPYNKVSLTHLSSDEIEFYFSALRQFVKLVQDESNEMWMSLNEDEVLIFDNYRLLHGRSSFKGERVLVTAYCSRDDWLSKARLVAAI